jgi:tetratricopeptide (TPR) repeat protein
MSHFKYCLAGLLLFIFVLAEPVLAIQKTVPILLNDLKIAYQTKKFDDAIAAGLELIKLEPDNEEGNLFLARAYYEKLNFAESGKYFRKSLELTVNQKDKHNKINAEYLSHFGVKMKEVGELIYSATPDNPPADFKSNYPAAKIILDQMVAYKPDSPRVFFWLFLCANGLLPDNPTEADQENITSIIRKAVNMQQDLLNALKANPTTDPKILAAEQATLKQYQAALLPTLLQSDKYLEEVDQLSRQIIAQDPDKIAVLVPFVLALQSEKYSEATGMMPDIIAKFPILKDDMDLIKGLINDKKYDDAKNEALGEISSYHLALTTLGRALFTKAQNLSETDEKKAKEVFIEANTYLEKASQLDPRDDSIKRILGFSLYMAGDYQRAADILESFYKADPKGTESGIISAIYECYVQLKNQAKISEYEKILEERYK